MPNKLKELVSKNKKRYQLDGFDLDLAYITPNIIAMGFPAENLEGVYRNHVDDVQRLLELKHGNHYKIYNLCQEKEYAKSKFKGCVERYPFEDHNPPPLDMMKKFCDDVKNWHNEHPENVAVIHCKAGKGRTGVMISAYLVYTKKLENVDEALNYYANQRTKDQKGVTIPSQIRYVHYFSKLLKEPITYKQTRLKLIAIRFSSIPHVYGSGSSCSLFFTARPRIDTRKFRSDYYEGFKKGDSNVTLDTNNFLNELTEDIRIDFYSKNMLAKESLFHFWFNTFFITKQIVVDFNNTTLILPNNNNNNSSWSSNDPNDSSSGGSSSSSFYDNPEARANSLKVKVINDEIKKKVWPDLKKELLIKVNTMQKRKQEKVEGISYQSIQEQQHQQLQQQHQQQQQQQQHQQQQQQQQHPLQHFQKNLGQDHRKLNTPTASMNTLPISPLGRLPPSPKSASKGHLLFQKCKVDEEGSTTVTKSLTSSLPLPPNTYLTLTLTKVELDKAVKDKQNRIFPADFSIQLYFTKFDSTTSPSPHIPNPIDDDEEEETDDTEDEEVEYSM